MSNQKYINGIFATRKQGNYGEYISIGITDEGIKSLQELTKSGEFRNFTLTPQKNDNNKYSAKPVVTKNSGSSDSNGDSDLPF
jgi:hypothetical protein